MATKGEITACFRVQTQAFQYDSRHCYNIVRGQDSIERLPITLKLIGQGIYKFEENIFQTAVFSENFYKIFFLKQHICAS